MTTKLKLFSRASLFAETAGYSGVVMGLGWWEWGLGSWVCVCVWGGGRRGCQRGENGQGVPPLSAKDKFSFQTLPPRVR